MRANLFDYATSELSQDAVICWLLAWADARYKESHPEWHSVSIEFVRLMLRSAKSEEPHDITRVQIRQQYKHIDILCEVNEDTVLVIEDKVGTREHSDQLRRYKDMLADDSSYKTKKIVLIYVQTGDQSDYGEVVESGFHVIDRGTLLDLFEGVHGERARGRSEILSDYTAHLRRLEDTVLSYRTLPLVEWTQDSWRGFFRYLQNELKDGGWGFVPNPSGGFLGYWWCITAHDVYLQLEEAKLCFKIAVEGKQQRAGKRSYWCERVLSECEKRNFPVSRPARFGNGRYMTVAHMDHDYRVEDSVGRINLAGTIATLRNAEVIAYRCAGVR